MMSESYERAKRFNFKEEELWKMKMKALEREEDVSRKSHIFHIEKVRNTKWKSLQQIKASMNHASKIQISEKIFQKTDDKNKNKNNNNNNNNNNTSGSKKKKSSQSKKAVRFRSQSPSNSGDRKSRLQSPPKKNRLAVEEKKTKFGHKSFQKKTEPPIIVLPRIIVTNPSGKNVEFGIKPKLKVKFRTGQNLDFRRIKYVKNLKLVGVRARSV